MIANSSRMRKQCGRPRLCRTWPARTAGSATPWSALAVGSAGMPVTVMAGHNGMVGITISAAAVLLSTAIVVTVPRWFQLLALRQASRDLREVVRLAKDIGSAEDVERLGNLLPSLCTYHELTTRHVTATATSGDDDRSVQESNVQWVPSALPDRSHGH